MNAEFDEIDAMRQAFASLAATARPLADCPEPPRLWAAARGEASPGETRDLIDHTASCPACAEAWRLAVQLEEAAPAQARPLVRRPAVAQWWPAAAAAALVVAALGVYQLREPAAPPAPMRSAAGSGLVSALPADAALPRDAALLQWRLEPAREGVRYTVQVTTDDLRPLAAADDLATPRYEVPAAALADLAPGALVLWRVESFLPDGRRLASETFTARIE